MASLLLIKDCDSGVWPSAIGGETRSRARPWRVHLGGGAEATALHRPAGRPLVLSATRPLARIGVAVVIALAQVVTVLSYDAVSGAQPTDPGEDFQAYSVRSTTPLRASPIRTRLRVRRAPRRGCSTTVGASPRVPGAASTVRDAHRSRSPCPMRRAGWDCAAREDFGRGVDAVRGAARRPRASVPPSTTASGPARTRVLEIAPTISVSPPRPPRCTSGERHVR